MDLRAGDVASSKSLGHPVIIIKIINGYALVAAGTGHGTLAVTPRNERHVVIKIDQNNPYCARAKQTGLSKDTYFYGDRFQTLPLDDLTRRGRCPQGLFLEIESLRLP